MDRIGLIFSIPNEYNQVLLKLLEDVLDIPSYWVRGPHEEIHFPGDSSTSFFNEEESILDNIRIKETLLSVKHDYYPIFSKFSIYESKILEKDSNNLEDFLHSRSHTVICISDVTQFMVVSKCLSIINSFEKIYEKYGYTDLEYIYYEKHKDTLRL
ncbi:DUF2691 family protein [Evansella cellulosilytica]|uniref:Uncharacterized protein n=1 Tax=Evansella cellulosilytica (strain ATCC 21833 / DSM 2522 / FERM P-1141 / JCM 9156 / N-4) TaxID=649639 RepID=E6TX14_EVAC2|nr:DUF2691 family protein [Evansella cellulosilytica]ADU31103.1 hypothetical protein Bcell_2850 [Evansella cellulosilytica DSM 2522]